MADKDIEIIKAYETINNKCRDRLKELIQKAKNANLIKPGHQAFLDYPPEEEGYFRDEDNKK